MGMHIHFEKSNDLWCILKLLLQKYQYCPDFLFFYVVEIFSAKLWFWNIFSNLGWQDSPLFPPLTHTELLGVWSSWRLISVDMSPTGRQWQWQNLFLLLQFLSRDNLSLVASSASSAPQQSCLNIIRLSYNCSNITQVELQLFKYPSSWVTIVEISLHLKFQWTSES